ncbi:MAG: branched-chain amino acid ABC transporter permease [Hyphomicrobiaceae bacterium]|nr:branched-chain amino acid ABC transporter permease [Hyphomicrobiaceae bacterium]MCC0023644.1 branched-chain amino acid ABC transporter permease [Hyphomicrobiaceae bacterium]
MSTRALVLFGGLLLLVLGVNFVMGTPYTVRMCVEALALSIVVLGLNIQWGYGGLFNFGVMGLMMVGGYAGMAMSVPLNIDFWNSDGPMLLGRAILAAGLGAVLIVLAHQAKRIGIRGKLGAVLKVAAWFIAYVGYRSQIDPAADYIEATSGFVGGLGLPVFVGWAFGAVLAGGVAYVIGNIALGLRTDYLAIATIGISEILRALIKNMDWLTRGTLTVSPIPWPTPLPQELQADGMAIDHSFIVARLFYFLLLLGVVLVILFLVERAYKGPWGRMMRAIRDNHVAAAAMGKDVKTRQRELFVFGAALMGLGGAVLVSFAQIFDPAGYQPINHTFIIWVMVIVGGAGNNYGALFGAIFIYIVWVISEPLATALFMTVSDWSDQMGWGAIPEIQSRALQMRVFVLGAVITVALRYAPQGLLPEVIGGKRRT